VLKIIERLILVVIKTIIKKLIINNNIDLFLEYINLLKDFYLLYVLILIFLILVKNKTIFSIRIVGFFIESLR
jgi:hypothetical protein